MLFGALFSTYIILRIGATEWPHGELSVWLGAVNTVILIGSSVTMVMAWASLKLNDWGKHRLYLIATFVLARRLPRQQVLRVRGSLPRGEGPSHSTFLAIYYTLTGLHGLHILGGMVVMAYFLGPGRQAVEEEPGAVHEPDRVHRAVLALRRPGVDLPVPGVVFVVGELGRPAHYVQAAASIACTESTGDDAFGSGTIRKSVRSYMIGSRAVRLHRHHRRGRIRFTSPCRWRSRSR